MNTKKNLIHAVVGSLNPVKINAFERTLQRLFIEQTILVEGMSAPSLVSEQPLCEQETLQGALNRVAFCQAQQQADFYVAMEGGVDRFAYGPATFAYVVIADNHQQQVGRSANLPIPDSVYQALQAGQELGPLMDKLFDTHNVKQKGGAIGLLTNGAETRTSTYLQALTLAMAPFLHRRRFCDSNSISSN